MSLKSINPANEEIIQEYEQHTDSQIESILERSQQSYFRMVARGPAPSEQILSSVQKMASILNDRADEFAKLITAEMGKPISQSIAEVKKCAGLCEYYAENASSFLDPRQASTESFKSYVRYDPIGPVLAIMPWNFPFWQVFRAAVPAICAGNPVILKHASNVTGSALKVAEIFLEAEIPEDLFQVLLIPGSKMEAIVAHPAIRGVSLTGSEAAGRSVAGLAGQNLKKCVLELGGSDPFIVLKDANLEKAARTAAQARCINSGQSCIAAKRFIVEESVSESFIEHFRKALEDLKVGSPTDEDTDIGPLARKDLRDDLHEQLQRSIQEGAQLLLGGKPQDGPGYFYTTTLIQSDSIYNHALQDETFGPLAAVIVSKDESEAVELANQSRFGLGGSLWTQDIEKAELLVRELETGSVTVNDLLRSDVRMPFGGIKDSGFGREMGPEGILEFVNQKSIRINK